jgi:hypothetical protein
MLSNKQTHQLHKTQLLFSGVLPLTIPRDGTYRKKSETTRRPSENTSIIVYLEVGVPRKDAHMIYRELRVPRKDAHRIYLPERCFERDSMFPADAGCPSPFLD